MPVSESLKIRDHFFTNAPAIAVRWLAVGVLCTHMVSTGAQSIAPTAPKVPAATSVASLGPFWGELSAAQREALKPLARSWDALAAPHKRKWIALAQTYPSLSPENKEKLHARMVEWAALSPKEREVARLNFVETKKVAPSDRAASWEAYQALSPEEKQKLANQAVNKPVGAAVAIKPVNPSKLANVPVTRHSPDEVRKEALSRQGVDQKTLLPQPPRPAPTASEPEPEAESSAAP